MRLIFDCIVIGSGIAGMTAAIYLKRSNMNVALIEKSAPGGLVNMATKIENYPGFDSIDGPTLSMNVFNQMKKLGVDYRYGDVVDIIDEGENKIIKTDIGDYECKVVIIAAGRVPKELGLDNEKQLAGRGISWCALCDGFLYKDKVVAVVGGGNSALEEALYLADIAKKVYVIHRSNTFCADQILQTEVMNKDNIELMHNSNIIEIKEQDNKLSEIVVKENDEIKNLLLDGLFIRIGFRPNLRFIENLNLKLDGGYIVVDQNMETSIKNIFACGDIIKKEIYQISTAVGEGATAGINAAKKINVKNS